VSDLFNPIGRNLPGATTGPNVLTAVVPDPPRGLLGLVTGTILKGTVLGRGGDGLTTIATDKGTVSVATNAALPAGSAVTLEVRNAGGDRLQVLILAVEAGNRNAEKTGQPGNSGAGGVSSAATAQSGAAGAAAHRTKTEPAQRQLAPPPIQIAGSSVKAVVVQAPPAASLLPTPDVAIEPFTAPSPPVTVPADAAQKAQLLAQARALIEPPSTPATPTGPTVAPADPDGLNPLPQGTTLPSATLPTGTLPAETLPSGALPSATQPLATPPSGTPAQAGAGSGTPGLLMPIALPSGGATILQPDVAARIAALFAAADAPDIPLSPQGATPSPAAGSLPPATHPGTATPVTNVPPGGMPMPSMPPGTMPAANVPPGSMPAALASAAGPLLAQFLAGTTTPAAAAPAAPLALQQGSELTLHVVAVLPAKGGEIEIAPEAARLTGQTAPLIGKVLGYTRAGHAVIDTPAGALMMQERTRLPVGAQVALVLEPMAPAAALSLPPITSPQQALLYLSNRWPALDDLLAVLRGAPLAPSNDPDSPPPPGVPQTGPKLAAGLAAAINAFRSGEMERLLTPMLAGRKLPGEKEEMVKRLKEEFTQLSDLAKDRPAVDWRALFLPIYDPRIGLTQVNLYYRHNSGEGSEKDKKDQGTRFLVDVNFAALGAFQLDGLIRGKRFDLMIRSRSRLSRNQRQDIIDIFESALEVGGNTGALEFRTVETFPVSPLDELRQSHDDLTA
jgi:hypothetical protein